MGLTVLATLAMTIAVAAPPAYADDPNPLFDLVDAAAQRLQTADPVAAYKWVNGTPIEDPPRVRQVLAAVTAYATTNRIAPDYVTAAFNDQINATDAMEYSRFTQWKLDPASAPTAPPELTASRAAIDGFNHAMVAQMALQWGLLHSAACPTSLEGARNAVIGTRQLDTLYQQALSFATRSYCR
ncbi:MAG: chorismate mutase [Mycobacterium sp.]|jgi:chorismate mutase|nr:chorismate mutase [Mycobacterium sp.]